MSSEALGNHRPQVNREDKEKKCPVVEFHVNRLPIRKILQGAATEISLKLS